MSEPVVRGFRASHHAPAATHEDLDFMPSGFSARVSRQFDQVRGFNARIHQSMAEPSGFSARFHDEPTGFGGRHSLRGGYDVSLEPIDEEDGDYEVALEPEDDEAEEAEPASPGEIHIGTHGRGGFVSKRKGDAADPDRVAMEQAFSDLYAEVGEIYGRGNLQKMLVLSRRKEIKLTVLKNGRPKEITLTLGELKEKMIRHRMAAQGLSRSQARQAVEQDIEGYFRTFDRALKNAGVSTIHHYSASGRDTRGSAIGRRALDITHRHHQILQKKQTRDLVLAAERGLTEDMGFMKRRGWSERDYGPLSFIGRIQGADATETTEKQKKAVDKVLRAEAFLIKLREKLSKKLEDLRQEIRGEDDEDRRGELQEKYRRYMELRDRMQNDSNRHALYAAAVYQTPEECYQAIFTDLYEEVYAHVDAEQRPSISEFTRSADSAPFRRYAAEIASTLISDAREYRRFCREFDIPPRKNHINLFLNQALAEEDPQDAIVDVENLGIAFEADEEDELREMVVETREQVDEPFGFSAGHSRIDAVDTGAMTPAQRLQAALDDVELRQFLEDPRTFQRGTTRRISDWWNNRS